MALMTKRLRPTGGVIRPISMLMVRMSANQIGSKPAWVMIGNSIGAVIRMIATGGRNMPATSRNTLMMRHHHPAVDLQVGDRVAMRLGDEQRRHHEGEQFGRRHDHHDHHALAHGDAEESARAAGAEQPVDRRRPARCRAARRRPPPPTAWRCRHRAHRARPR